MRQKPEAFKATLILPRLILPFGLVDILIFNGHISGIIRTMNISYGVCRNAVFFLARSPPGADGTKPFF
jgi:hypothetical protein